MKTLRKLLGYDDKFFDLLESSASEAQNSVQLPVSMLKKKDDGQTLDEFVKTRRKDKYITEEITEELCKTFVTPLERDDIEEEIVDRCRDAGNVIFQVVLKYS